MRIIMIQMIEEKNQKLKPKRKKEKKKKLIEIKRDYLILIMKYMIKTVIESIIQKDIEIKMVN